MANDDTANQINLKLNQKVEALEMGWDEAWRERDTLRENVEFLQAQINTRDRLIAQLNLTIRHTGAIAGSTSLDEWAQREADRVTTFCVSGLGHANIEHGETVQGDQTEVCTDCGTSL